MSSVTDYLEDATLNHVFRNTPLTSPSAVYLGLFTVAPTDAGGGTEVAGNGYAREAVTYGAPSGGAIANTTAATFTASGGAFGEIVAIGVFDAATGGNMLYWDTITPATMNDTDTLNFEAGDLRLSLD